MKPFLIIALLLLFVSCGQRGRSGLSGSKGLDGYSLVVNITELETDDGIACKRTDIFQDIDRNNFYSIEDVYQNGFLLCDGAIGNKGDKGDKGDDGESFTSAYQIVDLIDPCGTEHLNGYDEIIIKLNNGRYISSFSDNANGKNTRLGFLPSGSYVTTDGTNCRFTL